jgi:hypothetical protein
VGILTPSEILIAARRLAGTRPHLAADGARPPAPEMSYLRPIVPNLCYSASEVSWVVACDIPVAMSWRFALCWQGSVRTLWVRVIAGSGHDFAFRLTYAADFGFLVSVS